jgi:cytochrome c oxidase subunit IV
MADEVHAVGEPASERGEAVHLPGPSYLPVVVAAATTFAIVGVVISWVLVGLGLIVDVIAIGLWIRDTRRDIAELPLEH